MSKDNIPVICPKCGDEGIEAKDVFGKYIKCKKCLREAYMKREKERFSTLSTEDKLILYGDKLPLYVSNATELIQDHIKRNNRVITKPVDDAIPADTKPELVKYLDTLIDKKRKSK